MTKLGNLGNESHSISVEKLHTNRNHQRSMTFDTDVGT